MTRRIAFIIGCVAILSANGTAQNVTRTCAFVGQVPPTTAAQDESAPQVTLVVAADLDGDLPGYFTFLITRAADTTIGGTWLWNKKVTSADGSLESVGMLEGTITGGTVVVSSDGRVTEVKQGQLRIESGTGVLESLTGTGTLEGAIDPQAAQSFRGTLKLVF
jgi:hypothetical protein